MLERTEEKGRILIVDDDAQVRNVLCEALGESYECATAASAEEALLNLEGKDVVLSDIQMGGMSGLELIPRVVEQSPDAVVLMISGQQTIESAIEAMRRGAFDFLVKPFALNQLDAAIGRAFEHHRLKVAKRLYENHLKALVEQRTEELEVAFKTVEESYRMTLKALAASLEARDHETSGHSERVVAFSLRLGRELGLDAGQMRSLEFGSLLHDIGKIGVPDAILRKPGKLTEAEWYEMRKHPAHGQHILSGIRFLEGAALVVAQHHEQWDGSGYPLGLRGEEIDLNARIFAVADTFDAITSDRVYRMGKPYEAAAAELDEWAGRQFDPEVVAAFHRVPRAEWEAMRRGTSYAPHERPTALDQSCPVTADFTAELTA